MDNKDKFTYTYSAPTEAERREIESIRRQYEPENKTPDKVERLRQLHSKVVGRANAVALVLGIVGILIFGLGLSLVLEFEGFRVLGVIIAAVGAIPAAIAFPIYKVVIKAGKRKYGEEIVKLSDELLESSK